MDIAIYISFGVTVIFLIWLARHLLMQDNLRVGQRRGRFVAIAWLMLFPLKMPEDFMLPALPNVSTIVASFYVEFTGSWYWNVFYTNIAFTAVSLLLSGVVLSIASKIIFKHR